MKKHLVGILIFVVAFATSFLASPVRFSSFAVGSGLYGGFTSYESTYFVKLVSEREPYENPEDVKSAFEERIKLYSEYVETQKIINLEENRAIITFQTKTFGQGFCVIRKESSRLYNICSASLWHVLEFEKQKFPEN